MSNFALHLAWPTEILLRKCSTQCSPYDCLVRKFGKFPKGATNQIHTLPRACNKTTVHNLSNLHHMRPARLQVDHGNVSMVRRTCRHIHFHQHFGIERASFGYQRKCYHTQGTHRVPMTLQPMLIPKLSGQRGHFAALGHSLRHL